MGSEMCIRDRGIRRGHRELSFTLSPQPIKRLEKLEWKGTDEQARVLQQWLHHEDFHPVTGQIFELDFYENFHGVETLI